MRKKLTENTVLRNMILSYVIILVTVGGIWVFTMHYMSEIISSQNEAIYGDVLSVLAAEVDKDLVVVQQAALNISLSSDVKNLTSGDSRELDDTAQIMAVQEDLSSAMSGQSIIDDIYLYMKNMDYVVSYNTSGASLTYYRTYIEELGITYEDWKAWLDDLSGSGYRVLETTTGDVVYYVYQGPVSGSRRTAFVLLEISTSRIEQHLATVTDSEYIFFEITTADGQILVQETLEDDIFSYQLIEMTSSDTGWTYSGYVQNELFERYMIRTSRLVTAGICVIVTACAVALFFSFRTQYVPLKNLMDALEEKVSHAKNAKNEYHYIQKSFEEVFHRQEEDQAELESQRTKLREVYMQYLLSARSQEEDSGDSDLHLFHLEFLQEKYRMAIFSFAQENAGVGEFSRENEVDGTGSQKNGDGTHSQRNEVCDVTGAFCREDGVYDEKGLLCKGVWVERTPERWCYFLDMSDCEAEKLTGRLENAARRWSCEVDLSACHKGLREVPAAYTEIQQMMKSRPSVEPGLFLYEEYQKIRQSNQLLQNVLEYIRRHYADPDLSVEIVCASLGKSVSSVNKRLKEQGCESVLYYINKVRVEEAKRLFTESRGQVKVNEVMHLVGYERADTFIRVFKKYEKMTPGEFCNICKNDNTPNEEDEKRTK